MGKKSNAFTLIELLIVVAIIAILAAIAVPNFLEAQTRSKVARVKADMRTYVTATETYTVDHNRAPAGYSLTGGRGFAQGERWKILWMFTTPIAYLTSLPTDPFYSTVGQIDAGGGYRQENKYFQYNTFYEADRGTAARFPRIRSAGYLWVFYSVGPQRREVGPFVMDMLDPNWNSKAANMASGMGNIYDPTNGTVSAGKIYRTNKGELRTLEN